MADLNNAHYSRIDIQDEGVICFFQALKPFVDRLNGGYK